MSEAKTTQFKVCLKDSSLDVKVGDNVCVSADTNTIASLVSAIGAATTTLGMQSCLALGGAAAGMFVVAKTIAKHWPFAKTSDVKEGNVIQVSVPPEKKEMFENVVQKGKLQKVLQEEFKDIDKNLEGILGEDAYRDHGSQVLDLIRNLRVESINRVSANKSKGDGVIGEHVTGKMKKDDQDQVSIVWNKKGGSTTGVKVDKGGDYTSTTRGGTYVVASGCTAEDLKLLMTSKIEVAVSFEPLADKFKKNFKGSDTIEDVRVALLKERKEEYQILNKHTREIIDDDLTVEEAKNKGLLNKLLAVKKEK